MKKVIKKIVRGVVYVVLILCSPAIVFAWLIEWAFDVRDKEPSDD